MTAGFIGYEKLKEMAQMPCLSELECLRIFNVTPARYKAWCQQQESRRLSDDQSYTDIEEAWFTDQERIRELIKEANYVPGVKNMRLRYIRKYGMISMKRIRKLMKSMSLAGQRRKRDAYKHRSVHNHPFAVPAGNIVNREFYLGPRHVICGDITYVYYGESRKPYYWCVFKDAFTNEVLGHASGPEMTKDLVKRAYNMLKENVSVKDLAKVLCCIHTDQGSQFCSTEFCKLLSDDNLIQSMSRRGDPLDNCPIESFFGLAKSILIDIVALCKTSSQVDTMLKNFVDTYNTKRPQMELGGLTPAEYYDYATTGVYPLEKYFGVDAADLRSLKELRDDRGRFADEQAKKRREQAAAAKLSAAKEFPMGKVNPVERIKKDRARVRKLINRNAKRLEDVEGRQQRYEQVSWAIDIAEMFVQNASSEVLIDLCNVESWKNYPEMSYFQEMNEMF